MKEKIKKIIEEAILKQVFPGCVIGILDNNKKQILSFGKLTYDASAPKVSENTIYDIASLTKVIPTSSLALFLIDQEKLTLDDQMIKYLPEFKGDYREKITIRHLLTQTLNFDLQLSLLRSKKPEDILSTVLKVKLKNPPGDFFSYNNTTSLLLGMVVEKATNKKLDELSKEIFFEPLKMKATTFYTDEKYISDIAPSEIDSWRGEVRGKVHDESAYILQKIMIPGSAGLFSTVPDLMNFLEMFINKGKYKGKTFFSENILEQIYTNQISRLGESTGLGWELFQKWYMGESATEYTFGKTGFTGCSMVCDLKKEKALIILSNTNYPKRPKNREKINQIRREVADIFLNN